jgi:hypothetical protein
MHRIWFAMMLLGAVACGKKDKAAPPPVPSDAAVAQLPMPELGIDGPRRTNYVYGAGAKDHERARAAYKATPRDWATVRSAAEAALAKDGDHLDAHRLLASALAQAGDPAAVTPHLVAALAGDWLRWGPTLADDADLAGYLATPEGAALSALNAQMKEAVGAWTRGGVLVLGRRGPFKWPAKPGAQWATTRGELYAYSLEKKRYLRLTHTEHSVAAFVPSPSGAELAVIGFDKVQIPDAAQKDAPPLLARTWIETVDAATWVPTGKRAVIAKPARSVAVHYGPGEQLLATSYPAAGRWGLGEASTVSIDRTTGKTARAATPADIGPRAQVSFDEAAVEVPVTGLEATWEGEPPATSQIVLTAIGKTVDVPSGARATRTSVAVSPGTKRVAFATAADPCAKDGALPSLYAVDATTGQLRHILTADSRFGARWLDDDRLVYEDDAGGLRVFDAAAGREIARVTDKAGLALRGLSATTVPLCKKEPLAVELDTSGEVPLPHEEGEGPAATPTP